MQNVVSVRYSPITPPNLKLYIEAFSITVEQKNMNKTTYEARLGKLPEFISHGVMACVNYATQSRGSSIRCGKLKRNFDTTLGL